MRLFPTLLLPQILQLNNLTTVPIIITHPTRKLSQKKTLSNKHDPPSSITDLIEMQSQTCLHYSYIPSNAALNQP